MDERLDRIAALLKTLEAVSAQAASIRAELAAELERGRQQSARDNASTETNRRTLKTRRVGKRRGSD